MADTLEAAGTVPIVDYLHLRPTPHLTVNECVACGARYVDRRNACAACFHDEFKQVDLPTHGSLVSYTIVHVAAPGLPVPFVAAIVDCGGTWVRANLVNVTPDPAQIPLGAEVRLATFPWQTDKSGTVAVGFGFELTSPKGAQNGV